MNVDPEDVADFACWLAYAPDRDGQPVSWVWRLLSVEQVRCLYAARRDLMTMSKLASNTDARTDDIVECHAVVDALLAQCMEDEKPVPDPSVVIDREQLDALGRAATYLIEFMLRKRQEAGAAKRQSAKRGQYRGRR